MKKETKGIALIALILALIFLIVITVLIIMLVKNRNTEVEETTNNEVNSQIVENTPEIRIPENLDEKMFVD